MPWGCRSGGALRCTRPGQVARGCGAARGYRYGPQWPVASLFLIMHLPHGFYCPTRDGDCGPREASAEAPRATAGDPRDFRGEDTRRRVRGFRLLHWGAAGRAGALSRDSCARTRSSARAGSSRVYTCRLVASASGLQAQLKAAAVDVFHNKDGHTRGCRNRAESPRLLRISSESRSDIFALCQTGGLCATTCLLWRRPPVTSPPLRLI